MNIECLEQDDVANSLVGGIAVIELQFYYFPRLTENVACWLCHRLNSLND